RVAIAARGAAGERGQSILDRLRIAFALETRELLDLRSAHCGVVDFEQVDWGLPFGPIFVYANDRVLACVDARLRLSRGLFDTKLRKARLDRFGHPAHFLDFLDVAPTGLGELIRKP